MDDDGRKIVGMFKQVRSFFEQVALLLQNLDDQFEKEGWKKDSNTVTSNTSQSLTNYRAWFPDYLFRFYRNNRISNILTFVSVLLDDDLDGEYKDKIEEPLMTAGCFVFDKNKKIVDDFAYWWAKWYGYYGDIKKLEHKISTDNWKEEKECNEYKFDDYACFALPLVSIENVQDVKEKVIKPLLDLISKYTRE